MRNPEEKSFSVLTSPHNTPVVRRYIRSSSFQMAVLFTVLCGFAVFVLGWFSAYFHKGYAIETTQRNIDSEIRYVALADRLGVLDSLFEKTAKDPESPLYILLAEDGTFLKTNTDPAFGNNTEKSTESLSRLREGLIVLAHDKQTYAASVHTFKDGQRILVGVDITRMQQDFTFMRWLGIAGMLLIGLVIVASYLISTFVVTRTNKIAQTAHAMMETGDFSKRITFETRWDDLGYLAGVLNAFLARTEHLMQGIRDVSDHIAHDLRTPLTRLRNRLEDMHTHFAKRHDTEMTILCESLLEESDRLLSTFHALLRISRMETGGQVLAPSEIDLEILVQDVIALYEPLAEDKNITCTCTLSPVRYTGDRDLLFQAFSNLMDNAVKFTPAGGKITITLGVDENDPDKKAPALTICDTGPGVPDSEKGRIFERFYRAETSRHTDGNGLGLPLACAIVHLHKGRIILEDANSGLCVRIIL